MKFSKTHCRGTIVPKPMDPPMAGAKSPYWPTHLGHWIPHKEGSNFTKTGLTCLRQVGPCCLWLFLSTTTHSFHHIIILQLVTIETVYLALIFYQPFRLDKVDYWTEIFEFEFTMYIGSLFKNLSMPISEPDYRLGMAGGELSSKSSWLDQSGHCPRRVR